jgi:PEP-CTERM motif
LRGFWNRDLRERSASTLLKSPTEATPTLRGFWNRDLQERSASTLPKSPIEATPPLRGFWNLDLRERSASTLLKSPIEATPPLRGFWNRDLRERSASTLLKSPSEAAGSVLFRTLPSRHRLAWIVVNLLLGGIILSRTTSLFIASILTLSATAFAGSLIVNNDEWPLSNSGFSAAGGSNAATFAQDAALFLTGTGSGANIWIDSDNFGLNQSSLQTALGAYTLTDSGFSTFTLATLQNYSAVFLGGDNLTGAEETALIAYINGGGGVYIAAGTAGIGTGSAADEAAQWNAVINTFQLSLASVYNGLDADIATNSVSPVLNGVSQLFYDNGNSVSSLGPNGVIISSSGQQGLIGVYSSSAAAVPEPSTMLLMAGALAALGLYRAKRT